MFFLCCWIGREKGKIIGGTKGNKILDYVSGAPAKEQVVERIPNIFDYDELTKYGYSVSWKPCRQRANCQSDLSDAFSAYCYSYEP